MNISEHFTEEELTASDKARELGLKNVPDDAVRDNLHALADGLERIREVLDCPMIISSGFRCPKVNAAVKGSKKSAHMLGLAADFTAPGFGTPLSIARMLSKHVKALGINRMIYEGTWVHVDFPEDGKLPAGLVLTAHFGPSGTTYTQGV